MNEGGGIGRGAVAEKAEEGAAGVHESDLLFENACRVFQEESGQEAVLGECEKATGRAGGAAMLVETGCVEVEAL